MAPSSPYRQAVGQYGANSIAGRGPVQIPSSKRRGSAASDGGGYMQAATMGGQTRADKIAASRADGTFDAKRNAYNGANKGSFMDASGNIGPKAEMPTAPIAATTPATSAPTAQPATPAAMGPPKPRGAMFDGKPKAEFFADAARRGVASMPSGVYDQPGIAAKIKSPSGTPTSMAQTDAIFKTTPALAAGAAAGMGNPLAAAAGAVGALIEQPSNRTYGSTAAPTLEGRAAALGNAAARIADANKIIAENKATRKPMVAAASPSTPMPAKATPPQASGANFGAARSKPIAPAPQSTAAPAAPTPAKTFVTAARTQAEKNPQGISARLGTKPRGIEDDLLVGNLVKGVKVVGRKFAGAMKGQAARNPQGFAAKAMRFFGNSQPAMATR